MAVRAKVALVYRFFLYFVSLPPGKFLKVAGCALQTPRFCMVVVAELHGIGTRRLEFDIPASDSGHFRCRRKQEDYGKQQKRGPHDPSGLLMALDAVIGAFHVEGLLSVVTLATEIPFGQFAHVHLVGTLGHLEDLVMTSGALDAFSFDMGLMAEVHRVCVLGSELDVSTADLLGVRHERQHQACNKKHDQNRSLHRDTPSCRV